MKLERVMGIEPIDPDQNIPEKTDLSSPPQGKRAQIRAQISDADCQLLAQLVARWPELPAKAREAITQLVNTFVTEDPR